METVYLIAQTRRIFSNSRGDYCVLISPILLIFNRVQVLIDIKILCKFGNNWMKTVELMRKQTVFRNFLIFKGKSFWTYCFDIAIFKKGFESSLIQRHCASLPRIG